MTWRYPTWLDICYVVPACYGRVAIDMLLQTLAAQDRPLSDELRQRRKLPPGGELDEQSSQL